jgi:hypothetical protein
MYYNDGTDENMSNGEIHFWAEEAVKVKVLSENNCTAYFRLEVFNSVTDTWQSSQDFIEDLKAAVKAADPEDWFSTGLHFDSNSAYISGWSSPSNMKHLIGTYFAEPALLLRVSAYAPGSL